VTELLITASNISEENTLVIVSHDIESACAISDHVFVLGSDGVNPGSTILKTYDFLSMDLAYLPDIREIPAFRKVIQEIKTIM
jgi:ABC-type nitrate/sulfonate/bicarbonate transport system ATPase subunit